MFDELRHAAAHFGAVVNAANVRCSTAPFHRHVGAGCGSHYGALAVHLVTHALPRHVLPSLDTTKNRANRPFVNADHVITDHVSGLVGGCRDHFCSGFFVEIGVWLRRSFFACPSLPHHCGKLRVTVAISARCHCPRETTRGERRYYCLFGAGGPRSRSSGRNEMTVAGGRVGWRFRRFRART